jgi:heat shock protein HtpX
MPGALACFVACLKASGLLWPIAGLSLITGLLLVAHLRDRGYRPLLGAQFAITGGVSASLASMDCYMSSWVWAYLLLVAGGAAGLTAVRRINRTRLLRDSLGSFPALADLEGEFGVAITVLDTQRVRAVALGDRVFLSMGLLELLEGDELRAVVAHEVYHLRFSPSRVLSILLALTSLTFVRYDDEGAADAYAARVAGPHAIANAMERLHIKDARRRARALARHV